MKSRTRAGSSTMMLLELVISILIFSIASAICVQIFVRSHNLSLEARNMNIAVSAVSSAAELASRSDSDTEFMELLRMLYPQLGTEKSENGLKMWAELDEGGLILSVSTKDEDYMLTSDMSVTQGDRMIYSQQILHHEQRGN